MQHVMEEPQLSPLPKNILPDEPSPLGAKPLGNCSSFSPAALPMAHTQLSLMPAGGFLAQSYARDLCQSMGLIPELCPNMVPLDPHCVSFQGWRTSSAKTQGEQRGRCWAPWRGAGGRSCLVPTSNIHTSAQTDPNTLKRMLPSLCCMDGTNTAFFQFSHSSCSSRAQGPSPQARQKQHKHLLSPARPSCC